MVLDVINRIRVTIFATLVSVSLVGGPVAAHADSAGGGGGGGDNVVIVAGSPSTFVPANAAVAVNEDCQFCQTFAYARQFVISTDGDAILSDDARAQIRDLDGQVAALVQSDEPFAQMNDDLDGL